MNIVILTGRIGKNCEIFTTESQKEILNFSLATSEKYVSRDGEIKQATEWHNIVYFVKEGNKISSYLKKGQQISVNGKIRTRKWEDKEGNNRYTTEIVCQRLELLGSFKSEKKGNEQEKTYEDFQESAEDDLLF